MQLREQGYFKFLFRSYWTTQVEIKNYIWEMYIQASIVAICSMTEHSHYSLKLKHD